MLLTVLTLPNNFVASTTEIMASLITDLSPYLTLVIGVLLGVVVLEIIIGIFRK